MLHKYLEQVKSSWQHFSNWPESHVPSQGRPRMLQAACEDGALNRCQKHFLVEHVASIALVALIFCGAFALRPALLACQKKVRLVMS